MTADDIITVLRHDPPKVHRLIAYLSEYSLTHSATPSGDSHTQDGVTESSVRSSDGSKGGESESGGFKNIPILGIFFSIIISFFSSKEEETVVTDV